MTIITSASDAPARAAPAPPSVQPPDTTRLERVFPGVEQRLEALTPAQPDGYFMLGEEIAAEALTDGEFVLAKGLYAIACELWLNAGDSRNAASACIAIADVTASRRDRQWLRAVAASIEPAYAGLRWDESSGGVISSDVALDASQAIGFVRSGDASRARRQLDRPEIRDAIDRFAALATESGASKITDDLDLQAAQWPCPQCRGERVVVVTSAGDSGARPSNRNPNVPSFRVCPTCNGDPGWDPVVDLFIGTLRLESRLLKASQRSWSGQFASDQGAPLRDPNPREVAAIVGVSAAAPYWGPAGWSSEPDREKRYAPGDARWLHKGKIGTRPLRI
ncbi:MAG: hypothetical protein AAF235_09885, partial [Planctomycetota bacterium]